MKKSHIAGELPKLETDRLMLRKFVESDAKDMFSYASEPAVSQFVPWETHKSIEDTLEFLNFILNKYKEAQIAPWAIELKQTKKVIGTIDFVAWSPEHSTAEIGFILSKEYWGNGIILEAASKVIQFGFKNMNLNRIDALCMVENIQSQRVLQKIGMKLDGVLRKKYFIKGKYRDMAVYSILKEEFIKSIP